MYSKQKRIIALFLAVFVVSMNIAVAEVQAESIQSDAITDILVVVGSVVGTETALAYALATLGFTAASVAVYENRDTLINWCQDVKDDFIDFCAKSKEWADVTSAKIQNWLEGIGTGVLDKADDTWLALKDFCVDIFDKQQADTPIVAPIPVSTNQFSEYINSDYVNMRVSRFATKRVSEFGNVGSYYKKNHYFYAGFNGSHYDSSLEHEIYDSIMAKTNTEVVSLRFQNSDFNSSTTDVLYVFSSDTLAGSPFRDAYEDLQYFPVVSCDGSEYSSLNWWSHAFDYVYNAGKTLDTFGFCGFCWGTGLTVTQISENQDMFENSWMQHKSVPIINVDMTYSDFLELFDGAKDKRDCAVLVFLTDLFHNLSDWDIEYPRDDGISEEKTQEYVVDGSVEDVIERDGTLDNVDVVNPTDVENDKVQVDVEGVTIQDISKPFPDDRVITIDNTGDVVLPDKKPVPKPEDRTDFKDYTLTGIQEVFPFCIPWDFYLVVKTLSAEPKAPKFEWTITYYDRKKKKEEKLEIDFSMFDSVAKVLRTMELLVFILFLTLKTRDLIKG